MKVTCYLEINVGTPASLVWCPAWASAGSSNLQCTCTRKQLQNLAHGRRSGDMTAGLTKVLTCHSERSRHRSRRTAKRQDQQDAVPISLTSIQAHDHLLTPLSSLNGSCKCCPSLRAHQLVWPPASTGSTMPGLVHSLVGSEYGSSKSLLTLITCSLQRAHWPVVEDAVHAAALACAAC